MVLLEFSMTPTGQGESVSIHVARILDVVDHSGGRVKPAVSTWGPTAMAFPSPRAYA